MQTWGTDRETDHIYDTEFISIPKAIYSCEQWAFYNNPAQSYQDEACIQMLTNIFCCDHDTDENICVRD